MTIIPENLALRKPEKSLLEKMEKSAPKEEILFQIESDFHTIQVVKSSLGRFLKYADTYQAGYIDSKYYRGNLPYLNYFLIPYLMNPDIKNILLIGLGSGILLNQYKKLFGQLKKIDIADIEENIPEIAQKYFDFELSDDCEFFLQDAIVFLNKTKKKYDLIAVDVAGDEGIDERFTEEEYLKLVKSRLTKNGIFVSNMPSSCDVFNKKNKFALGLIKKYREIFSDLKIFCGKTSNRIFYKVFFDIDRDVLDIVNLILIASKKPFKISENFSEIEKIGVKIEEYLSDEI